MKTLWMKVSRCKGCDARIVWASVLKPDGSRVKIPLDPRPPVYVPLGVEMTDGLPEFEPIEAAVSHFSTCVAANLFSGKGGHR